MSKDTIYRQDAIDVIYAIFPVDSMKSEYAQGIACGAALAKTYVEQLPSAQPIADVRENVRGEWIEDNSREKSMMWRCSVCGRIAYYPTIGKRKSYKKHCGYNYCPNCGADMREVEK